MKEYYTHGTEAYAPIPREVPSHLPEDPKKTEMHLPKEKHGVSLFTVISSGVILILFVILLMSMARLFEARSERAELQRQRQQLQTQQDRLIAQYESMIDMDAVEKRAEELGMHIPWAEQIRYVHFELPTSVAETAESIENGLVEDFYTMMQDAEAYFSPS